MSDTNMELFKTELQGFAKNAEATLKEIEADLEGNRPLFERFATQLFTIRGTSQQLGLTALVPLAALGEELALKAQTAPTRGQLRKCVQALWDAVTTLSYLVENQATETAEEQDILTHRLESMIQSLGGKRDTLSADEIEALLQNR